MKYITEKIINEIFFLNAEKAIINLEKEIKLKYGYEFFSRDEFLEMIPIENRKNILRKLGIENSIWVLQRKGNFSFYKNLVKITEWYDEILSYFINKGYFDMTDFDFGDEPKNLKFSDYINLYKRKVLFPDYHIGEESYYSSLELDYNYYEKPNSKDYRKRNMTN